MTTNPTSPTIRANKGHLQDRLDAARTELANVKEELAAQRERSRLLEDALTALPDDYARASTALRKFDREKVVDEERQKITSDVTPARLSGIVSPD